VRKNSLKGRPTRGLTVLLKAEKKTRIATGGEGRNECKVMGGNVKPRTGMEKIPPHQKGAPDLKGKTNDKKPAELETRKPPEIDATGYKEGKQSPKRPLERAGKKGETEEKWKKGFTDKVPKKTVNQREPRVQKNALRIPRKQSTHKGYEETGQKKAP